MVTSSHFSKIDARLKLIGGFFLHRSWDEDEEEKIIFILKCIMANRVFH